MLDGLFGDVANAHDGAVHFFGHLALLLGGHCNLGVALAHLRHRAGDGEQCLACFVGLLHAVVGLERAFLHELDGIAGAALQGGDHQGDFIG
ncbi:hypothetical protein D3C86_1885780 [compost metagenome]